MKAFAAASSRREPRERPRAFAPKARVSAPGLRNSASSTFSVADVARSDRVGVGGGRLDQEEALAREDERHGEERDRGHRQHGDGVLHDTHSLYYPSLVAGLREVDGKSRDNDRSIGKA